MVTISLCDFGWNDQWTRQFSPYAKAGLQPARVSAVYSHQFEIQTESGPRAAVRSGKLSYNTLYAAKNPSVGDYVAVSENPHGPWVISDVLPRISCLQREAGFGEVQAQVIAANVDTALLVQSVSGDFNVSRAQRYLAMVWDAGITPIMVLTKADLLEGLEVQARIDLMKASCPGVDVIAISAVSGKGVEELQSKIINGKTFVAMGSSGVGKSTLLNMLMGETIMVTKDVREDDQKGRHTTTHRQMFRLPWGALFIDTPGMREVALFNYGGLDEAFRDIAAIASQCKFRDCAHEDEPGCAVREAIADGSLEEKRWQDYLKLQNEERHFEAKQILLRKQISNARKKRNKTHYKDHIRGANQTPEVE